MVGWKHCTLLLPASRQQPVMHISYSSLCMLIYAIGECRKECLLQFLSFLARFSLFIAVSVGAYIRPCRLASVVLGTTHVATSVALELLVGRSYLCAYVSDVSN